ncbi:MAG: NAD(P)-dependent oxidoreductase [Novosphingobium sp.]|uniref:NAD(P)-dependent oxidoreductase n=1 Tax=Novosphingobium sp. TaxID=1874826 RepID=UPI00301B6974
MSTPPILLIGATGHVGNHTARTLRKAHPGLPLLFGVRDVARAAALVSEIGNAEAVAIDLSKADLGLGDRAVSAVGIFLKDNHTNAVRFARDRGVPFTSISTVVIEMATEVASFIRNPNATLVLSSQWLAGAGMMVTLQAAKAYSQLESITMIGVIDAVDLGGPAAMEDSVRLGPVMPGAMVREKGAYRWLSGDDIAQPATSVDGSALDGFAYGVFDVQALTEVTGAANIKFVFAVAETAGTKSGGAPSSEVIVELAGTDLNGHPKSSRHAMVSLTGQAPITGFGVALVLERATGLDGQPAPAHGLYFVENIITPDTYIARAEAAGFTFHDL